MLLSQLLSSFRNVRKRSYSSSIPLIIERAANGGERIYDIYSRLLKDRIICLHAPVTFHQSYYYYHFHISYSIQY